MEEDGLIGDDDLVDLDEGAFEQKEIDVFEESMRDDVRFVICIQSEKERVKK